MTGAARAEKIFLEGPAGRIEATMKRRPGAGRAAVVCHPHPQYGGTMDNKVVYRAARALHGAGMSVLRFNFRGIGESEGAFDEGVGERDDLRAAIDWLARDNDELLVGGFSFGSWVALDVGERDDRVSELLGIGLPVDFFDFGFVRTGTKPLLVVHGDRDAYGSVSRVRSLVDDAGPRVRLSIVAGADHFFTGSLEPMMDAVSEFTLRR